MVKWNVDKADDYSASGFGRTLGFGRKPVLLVVDFVMAYLDPSSPLYAGVEAELAVLKHLVAAARKANVPVIWTRVEYEPGGADGGYFYRKINALKVFDSGSALGAFHSELAPVEGEVILTKQYPSAFFGTELAQLLSDASVDTVFVTGLTTSGCVRASALDALQNGFIPVLIEDACGDRDEEVQRANIFDLGAKYADIIQSDDALAYFSRLKT